MSCPIYRGIWLSREELRLSLVHKGEPWQIVIHENALIRFARYKVPRGCFGEVAWAGGGGGGADRRKKTVYSRWAILNRTPVGSRNWVTVSVELRSSLLRLSSHTIPRVQLSIVCRELKV